MLYLFNNREKLAKAVAQFRDKNPGGAVYKFDNDNFAAEQEKLAELLESGADLFGEQSLIVLDDIAELGEIALEKIKASATKVLRFKPELLAKRAGFNLFALADALAARDRAQLWLGYQQALLAGVSGEEIYWRALVWKVKTLLQSGSRRYTRPELASLSAKLVRLWHDTKREEGRDFNLELERLLLTV